MRRLLTHDSDYFKVTLISLFSRALLKDFEAVPSTSASALPL